MQKVTQPQFSWRFLLPQYWLVWVGLILLFTVTLLPLSVLRRLAKVNAFLLSKLAKKRVKIFRPFQVNQEL
ncbi:MAG: hypothetical protein ABWW63_05340, partial [Glaciecola sp.]